MKQDQRQAKLDSIASVITNRAIDIELAKSCLNPVPGEGSASAELMIIGEAPGAKEDQLGRPFVGASGKFLDAMLASIGLERQDVFITNIVKFRPPKNRDPSPGEIKACMHILYQEIDALRPKLIVLLGRHASNTFFPDLTISEAHGEPLVRAIKLGAKAQLQQTFLPLYHPAAALYNRSLGKTLLDDFAKIPQILAIINKVKL
jgi:DNA polymerase